jgi:ribosomal protein L20A (L18A)
VEVYGIHLFYDENEMWDYLDEEYPDIKEIG